VESLLILLQAGVLVFVSLVGGCTEEERAVGMAVEFNTHAAAFNLTV